jgi:FkbH-like protein
MSSICSKNEFDPVKQRLTTAGLWDYFIFPKISWSAKGGAIAEIIEQANLRPDNVLFIDDNPLNIEELRFRFPAMMLGHPDLVLPRLLDLEQARGKDDRSHSRLAQYKKLEQKIADQAQTTLSNEAFLRQCDIRLRFDYDVEAHLDRIIELINRSNQLNYTKIRLETEAAIAGFKADLRRFDIVCAAIFAGDRYGDHGLIGFYMQMKTERTNRLLHFVWSCRMMNTGLEQYVYQRLGAPEIQVVGPVANPIMVFERIDWVTETAQGAAEANAAAAPKLLLLGSCDLTAVASYCSPNRVEFVNGVKHGVMTRYDDFGFILNDPGRVAASRALPKIPAWDKADFAAFRQALASSDVLIISLSAAMKGAHLLTDDDVVVRIHPEGLGDFIDLHPLAGFMQRSRSYVLATTQKIALLNQSLAHIQGAAAKATHKFLLGANTRGAAVSPATLALMTAYNTACAAFCSVRDGWHFVPIDEVVAFEKLVDDRHYTRLGYFDIASRINEKIKSAAPAAPPVPGSAADSADLIGLIRAGRRVSRFGLFGVQRGAWAQVKRAVKLTPFAGLVRKFVIKPARDPSLA